MGIESASALSDAGDLDSLYTPRSRTPTSSSYGGRSVGGRSIKVLEILIANHPIESSSLGVHEAGKRQIPAPFPAVVEALAVKCPERY